MQRDSSREVKVRRKNKIKLAARSGGGGWSMRSPINASITTPDALIIPVMSETIPDTKLMSLVDLGSSDSFVNSGFVEKHHLAVCTIPTIRPCLIDGTCNSVITQAIKFHIRFSSGEKQTVNFYVMPLDSSCTLRLKLHP